MKQLNSKIKCYDNLGETVDRYTVVYLNHKENAPRTYVCLGMSANPFHPQGFCQHSSAMLGRHLGKKIEFENLPPDCQKAVFMDIGIEEAILS